MSGTKEGARKAHETKIKKDPDFYRKIGRLSWKNDRSHAVGFALMEPEKRRELGQKGGKKTKKDYTNVQQKTVSDTDGLPPSVGGRSVKALTMSATVLRTSPIRNSFVIEGATTPGKKQTHRRSVQSVAKSSMYRNHKYHTEG